jgi:hypothetical protein
VIDSRATREGAGHGHGPLGEPAPSAAQLTLVDTRTGRAMFFIPGRDRCIEAGQDLTYPAVVVPLSTRNSPGTLTIRSPTIRQIRPEAAPGGTTVLTSTSDTTVAWMVCPRRSPLLCRTDSGRGS